MKAVELIHVNKQFDGARYRALDDVSLEIEDGEFVTILGTSGCGKTTLIKSINRLHEIDSGSIQVQGENIRDKDVVNLRRGIGYVIQQAGLFPHMTVAENIAVVPGLLKWEKERTQEKVVEMMELVALSPQEFYHRYPRQLSGGQQQRVGLARAMITDPPLMLLDEPFGAIDAINREMLQKELKRIHQRSKKTYLFVTHDIREAFLLGTRTVIMNQGQVVQYDTPKEILSHPANEFVISLLNTLGNDFAIGGGGI